MAMTFSPVRLVRASDLVVPTGKLIARDPLTSAPVSPFKKVQVAPGTYSVWLSLVALEDEGEVIGAALSTSPMRCQRTG